MHNDLYVSAYNPDVLSCIANLSNDEVFTPPEVANAMLDMLPQELFQDPNTTFLDPAAKSGVFLREIAKRLLVGLEDVFPDLQERIDHIFQKQLFGIAITEITSLLARRSVYCSKTANGNYSVCRFGDVQGNIRYKRIQHKWKDGRCLFCGASQSQYDRDESLETHAYELIHTTKPEDIFHMKFDVIISNPPYSLNDGGGMGTSARPIYQFFVENAKKLRPRYISMIIPSRWFSGGKGLDRFRDEMLHDKHITHLTDYFNAGDCFPGVDISGGVCYFLWDRDHAGECEVISYRGDAVSKMRRTLLEKDADTFIRFNEAVSILRKVQIHNEGSFADLVSTRKPFGVEATDTIYEEEKSGRTFIWAYPQNGYIDNACIRSNRDTVEKYKLFISKAYGERGDFPYFVIGKPFIGKPGEVCSETYLLAGCSGSIDVIKNIRSYFATKFFRFFVLFKKNTQNAPNWTYSDEQRAKASWVGEDNPYAALPRMVMLTYKIPESIQQIARQGEFDEFDLNVFFSAEGRGSEARFVYEDYVQKWLDLIRGAFLETTVDELKQGAQKPPMPFSDVRLLNVLQHTLWFLPNVASCQAMANLLAQRQNAFYHDYAVLVCAGTEAGIGVKALEPVRQAMADPLDTKTITLSCGKLTTGVTIKPWTGIFMLRNLTSPETYFQAAFRVQSPWEVTDDSGKREIIKKECYVFDFALDRALKQIADYSCRLNVGESNPEKKVGEFINFLPVLAYDGINMRQVNAAAILDIAMAGTSATLLAKRWESALLVNVDNETLARLLASKEAMDALMRIEVFRSLNTDIQTIINKSEAVKRAKRESEELTPKQKKELTEVEKEYKSKRKMIQEKLIKFATRVPVFMYLTDYREYSLKDVITQLEPDLFRKVTGLNVKDFELLVSLNVFNEALMNDAVYKFKRYEDASLSYTGIDRHAGGDVGLYSTVLSREDYDLMAGQLIRSMEAPAPAEDDVPEKPYYAEDAPDEEDEPEPAPVVKKPPEPRPPIAAKTPIPTYRPAYIPPAPAPVRKVAPTVDVSGITAGSAVFHKAFGTGIVQSIGGGYIVVSFDGLEKKFQFPGAFQQGFLRKG